MTSDKSYRSEQRLNDILRFGYPWPSVVMNSAEQTGINGTNQNVGSISTGSNYPTLQVGKSYLVEGHFHYIGTASVPGNVVAIVVDWTGSGSATHTDWAAQHWEDGGQVINNVGNSSTNPFTNAQGSNSYGSIASLPFTSFGPGMHTNLNPSYSIRLSGGISDVQVADTIQVRITSAVATITLRSPAWVRITPVNFAL